MTNQIRVRPMAAADLPAVAQVHLQAFGGFFLAEMGPAFLRAYYGVVLRYRGSIALVAQDEAGRVAGFAVGFLDPSGFYAFLKSQALRLLPGMVLGVIRRPQLVGRVLLNRSRVSKKSKSSPVATTVELASIAVASREKGVGSSLMQAFVEHSRGIGGSKIALTTDLKDNDQVQSFYRKHGFLASAVERQGAREMLALERDV